jgi:hypothetical protein
VQLERAIVVLGMSLASVSVARSARSQGEESASTVVERDRWATRPVLVEGHVGVGTPYGSLGAALAWDLVRYFGVVAGGGVGLSGPQAAAGLRVRLPLSAVAIGAELTWSGGPYEVGGCAVLCFPDSRRVPRAWSFAHWVNVAPAVEIRSQAGFSVRIYGGYGELLNESDGQCAGNEDEYACPNGGGIGFVGTAFGGAF